MLTRLVASVTNNSPISVATGAAGLTTGILSYLGVINLIIGFVATSAGAFIAILGAIKAWKEFKKKS